MRIVSRILAARNARAGRPLTDVELEDLTQDTLLTIWRKLPTYEGRAALETWTYRFCFLELMNAVRRKARAPVLLDEIVERAAPPEGDGGAGISHYLRHLTQREAQVLHLRHVEDLSFAEIAEALETSASSAKTHYYRGLQKLRSLREGVR